MSSFSYRKYRLQISWRILILIVLGTATIFIAWQTPFWLVSFWTGLATIILTVDLIRVVERSHRELSSFLLAIQQGDFSNTYPSNNQKDDLKFAFFQILNVFQTLRSEKESNHQYLQTIVDHVGIALLCYNEKGDILLLNRAAQQLFQKPYFHSLEVLGKVSESLLETVKKLGTGDKVLVPYQREGLVMKLSVQATEFKLLNEPYKLISFQNIQNELDAQELEAWQKLIRVLTHEIMNSVIPISSLSGITNQMIEEVSGDLSQLDEDEVEDLKGSLNIIEGRSKGLVNFVKAYKSLTHNTVLNLSEVEVSTLFQRVMTLLGPKLSVQEIEVIQEVTPSQLSISIDAELIEQVLINLVLNAADALQGRETPRIELTAKQANSRQVLIMVRDNGEGIKPELMENIFVPFFTTKKKGSGIGLSLSRQIMRQHKGSLNVRSIPGNGASFHLLFPRPKAP